MNAIKRKIDIILKMNAKDVNKKADEVDKKFAGLGGVGASAWKAIAIAAAAAAVAIGAVITKSTLTAARTEVLGGVMDFVGQKAGYAAGEINRNTLALEKSGIATQEALGLQLRLIQSNIDLSKATTIGRIAQNAAVIAGVNSSEAALGITDALVKMRPILLKQYGIIINLNALYSKTAEALGKTRAELTVTEQRQAFFNAIVERSTRIQGAYTKAMEFAGKRLTSLPRHFQAAANAIGRHFLPAFNAGITVVEKFLKTIKNMFGEAEEDKHSLEKLGTAFTNTTTKLERLNAAFKEGTITLNKYRDALANIDLKGVVAKTIDEVVTEVISSAKSLEDVSDRIRILFEADFFPLESYFEIQEKAIAGYKKFEKYGELKPIPIRFFTKIEPFDFSVAMSEMDGVVNRITYFLAEFYKGGGVYRNAEEAKRSLMRALQLTKEQIDTAFGLSKLKDVYKLLIDIPKPIPAFEGQEVKQSTALVKDYTLQLKNLFEERLKLKGLGVTIEMPLIKEPLVVFDPDATANERFIFSMKDRYSNTLQVMESGQDDFLLAMKRWAEGESVFQDKINKDAVDKAQLIGTKLITIAKETGQSIAEVEKAYELFLKGKPIPETFRDIIPIPIDTVEAGIIELEQLFTKHLNAQTQLVRAEDKLKAWLKIASRDDSVIDNIDTHNLQLKKSFNDRLAILKTGLEPVQIVLTGDDSLIVPVIDNIDMHNLQLKKSFNDRLALLNTGLELGSFRMSSIELIAIAEKTGKSIIEVEKAYASFLKGDRIPVQKSLPSIPKPIITSGLSAEDMAFEDENVAESMRKSTIDRLKKWLEMGADVQKIADENAIAHVKMHGGELAAIQLETQQKILAIQSDFDLKSGEKTDLIYFEELLGKEKAAAVKLEQLHDLQIALKDQTAQNDIIRARMSGGELVTIAEETSQAILQIQENTLLTRTEKDERIKLERLLGEEKTYNLQLEQLSNYYADIEMLERDNQQRKNESDQEYLDRRLNMNEMLQALIEDAAMNEIITAAQKAEILEKIESGSLKDILALHKRAVINRADIYKVGMASIMSITNAFASNEMRTARERKNVMIQATADMVSGLLDIQGKLWAAEALAALGHGNFWKAAKLSAAVVAAGMGSAFAQATAARSMEEAEEEDVDVGFESESTAGSRNRISGTTTRGPQTIYISPSVSFNGEMVIVGDTGLSEASETIGGIAVDAVKQALETGEISV